MKTASRFALVFSSALALSVTTGISVGCASPANIVSGPACVTTPFISPTSVTLDHTVAGNSQQFSTGTDYSSGCIVSPIALQYFWNVSDTIDASITSGGVASCSNASLNPITVSTTVKSYPNGPSNPPTYVASGFPSATLTCK
jgi:hypothetical protein